MAPQKYLQQNRTFFQSHDMLFGLFHYDHTHLLLEL
jgi:hypothetical protein